MSARRDKKPELLLPAGSMETLQTAVRYGADAVYLGGKAFSLRARAQNFSVPELREAVAWAHERKVRIYVTANIFAREGDFVGAADFFRALSGFPEEARPDALLIADPGMLLLAREHCPAIPLHLSTQANATNAAACRFWQTAGIARIVLARELSLAEIRAIRAHVPADLELECFVHGAMCISYSGRCLLSRAMTGRDANRGACAHPCRYRYALVEEKRPGEYFPIEEDERGSEILAPDDLCMIAHMPELMAAGIDSFKVEGRMKNALYVASIARAYRRAIDLCRAGESEEADAADDGGRLEASGRVPTAYERELPALIEEVRGAATRPMGTGFYFGDSEGGANRRPVSVQMAAGTGDAGSDVADMEAFHTDHGGRIFPGRPRSFLGVVREVSADGGFVIEQRNRFSVGEIICAIKPCGRDGTENAEDFLPDDWSDLRLRVLSILGEDGESVENAVHPKEIYRMRTERVDTVGNAATDRIAAIEAGDVLYRLSP